VPACLVGWDWLLAENPTVIILKSRPARPVVAFGVTPQNAVAKGEAPPVGGPREAGSSRGGQAAPG